MCTVIPMENCCDGVDKVEGNILDSIDFDSKTQQKIISLYCLID